MWPGPGGRDGRAVLADGGAAQAALPEGARAKAGPDDRKVLGGITHVKRNGLRWQDAPAVYGPCKTLYNRSVRWSRLGVFARIVRQLAQPGADTLIIV